MSTPTYKMPPNPEYHDAIPKLRQQDPGDAETVFNPLIQAMLENTEFVRLLAEAIRRQNNTDHAAIRRDLTEQINTAVAGIPTPDVSKQISEHDKATNAHAALFAALKAEVDNVVGGAAAAGHTHTPAQIGAAAAKHVHTKADITDFPESMPASDVPGWAKSPVKPKYTADEVDAASKTHKHSVGDIVGLASSDTAVDIGVITIPRGRMLGDVDGDGKITQADADLALAKTVGNVTLDDVAIWCADVGKDGRVNADDSQRILNYIIGRVSIALTDYYNNWTYDSAEETWTTTVPMSGLKADMSAAVVMPGEWGKGMFSAVQILEGAIRIRSAAPPVEDTPCVVLYGAGDGTAVICTKLLPTPEEIGARPASWMPTTEDVGAVPTERRINGKALSEDIELNASDVKALPSDGTAKAATKLETARNLQVNLASTSAANFDGTKDVQPGVTGVLPVTNGGTGVKSLTGTDYTTYRPRQIALLSSVPTSLASGQIALVYV